MGYFHVEIIKKNNQFHVQNPFFLQSLDICFEIERIAVTTKKKTLKKENFIFLFRKHSLFFNQTYVCCIYGWNSKEKRFQFQLDFTFFRRTKIIDNWRMKSFFLELKIIERQTSKSWVETDVSLCSRHGFIASKRETMHRHGREKSVAHFFLFGNEHMLHTYWRRKKVLKVSTSCSEREQPK